MRELPVAREPLEVADPSAPGLVAVVTKTIAADLSELLVEGESAAERRAIVRVAELYRHEELDEEATKHAHEAGEGEHRPIPGFSHERGVPSLSMARQNELGREVEARTVRLREQEPARYQELLKAALDYDESLESARVTDAQVWLFERHRREAAEVSRISRRESANDPNGRAAQSEMAVRRSKLESRVSRWCRTWVLASLSPVGVLFWWLPYQLPRLATRLAKSETDVISTYKIGLSLISYPLWFLCLLALGLALRQLGGWLIPVAAILSAPSALWLVDYVDGRLRSPRDETLSRLAVERRSLRAKLELARNETHSGEP